jgi:hypothetical protein
MATLPQPMACDDTVTNDVESRTLTVRPIPGPAALEWRTAVRRLLEDADIGLPGAQPNWDLFCRASEAENRQVWADGPGGQRRIARGVPTEGGALRFTFPRSDGVYAQLVSQPGLRALVTVDRSRNQIVSVKFRRR